MFEHNHPVDFESTLRNGRNFECHSEDPWPSSELGVACVHSLQNTGVAATIQHFVVNDSEYHHYVPVWNTLIQLEFFNSLDFRGPVVCRQLAHYTGQLWLDAVDAAVVFAGLNAEWDNEGLDRSGISLPHSHNALIARVVAANPRTVVVLQAGSPVALPWLLEVAAVLQAWYPGQECGNAIADVLLGAAEPGGRLPQTWPVRLEDTVVFGNPLHYLGMDGHVVYAEGVFTGYRHYQQQNIAPLFPFGHGLPCTQFAFGALRLASTELQPGGALLVDMDVYNVGSRAGQTVVQRYVSATRASLPRPAQELKGSAKLSLAARAFGTARFRLGMRAFAFYNVARAAPVAEAGGYQLHARLASADLVLAGDWVLAV